MDDREKYSDLTPMANEWLRRYQVPTDRTTDRTSLGLLKVFIQLVDPNMEKLPGLGRMPLDEANEILTVELSDIGVRLGEHPAREVERTNKIFEFIRTNPYVTYSTGEKGVRVYHSIPLLKYGEASSDGKCKLIFNDQLRRFFFPEKDFALCSQSLLDEIERKSIYARVIFEEAISYQNMCRNGNEPYFTWSVKEARQKFSFDRMEVSKEDNTQYISFEVKKMRIDNLISKVMLPAIAILKEFFPKGKTKFWIELNVRDVKTGKSGRPPKDFFRFTLKKSMPTDHVGKEAEQLELFDYEEMNTLYYIREQLKNILSSKKKIEQIIEQLKNNEQVGTHEDVLATIKTKISRYGKKSPKERASLILSILGKEHHLGDPLKFGEMPKDDKKFWPDSLEERIKVMMESPEVKDKAAQDFNLSSDEVDGLLQGDFLSICKSRDKLKKDWSDAFDYFFNWMKKLNIKGPLNNVNNGHNEQRTTSNEESAASSYGRTAMFFRTRAAHRQRR